MMTTPKIDAKKRSFFQDRKMWFWIAAGFGLLTLIVLVIFLQSLVSTTKYYVLNQDVPARTQITTSMLQEEVVSSGGQPPTAYSLSDVANNTIYAKYSLHAGDILTQSNAGDLIPLRQGIPSSFVITSFSANPNNAAGGNVKRGDYVDVFYVGDSGANLLLQRVLVLDTTTDLSSSSKSSSSSSQSGSAAGSNVASGSSVGSAAAASNSAVSAYRDGIPSLYTVGVSQTDALKLAAASKGQFYIVLSSSDEVGKGAAPQTLGMSLNDALNSPATDSGAGTDATFGKSTASASTPSAAPAQNSTPSAAATASPSTSASSSTGK